MITRKRGLWSLLILALVSLVVTNAVIWKGRQTSVDNAALVAASQEAKNFFGLDYRTVEEGVQRVLDLATGDFKSEYGSRRDQIIKEIRAEQVVVTATVPTDGTAVEYMTSNQARVLIALDVNTKSKSDAKDLRYRARLELKKVDGKWLVSKLEQVG